MRFIMSLKPCLNLCSLRWFKPRRSLSFIPYPLQISNILLGKGPVNSNIFRILLLPGLVYSTQLFIEEGKK